MKTKKEHPAGDQVQDLITFFGHERLSVGDHFKDIDNFLLFKDFPDNRPERYQKGKERVDEYKNSQAHI